MRSFSACRRPCAKPARSLAADDERQHDDLGFRIASRRRGRSERVSYQNMGSRKSALEGWSAEQIATARRWVQTWQDAAPRLEQIRRQELRQLDAFKTIALLCGPADYRVPPRAPRPTSGLVEQQRYFRKLRPL